MHKEYAARRSLGFRSIYRARQLFFILLLPLIWLVVFKYAPMVGVQIAFRDKDPNGNGIQDEIPMSGASGFLRQRQSSRLAPEPVYLLRYHR